MTVLDEEASDRAGTALELLPAILAERRAPQPRWRIGDTALHFLWGSRTRGLQSVRRRNLPEAEELRDAGLLNGFGAPTAEGQRLLAVLGSAGPTLVATLTGGPRVERWTCRFAGADALVDAHLVEVAPAHALDLVPRPVAVGRLLDWLGVAPAWSLGVESPVAVDHALVDARCADPSVPPPADAGPVLRRAWRSGPWRRVLVADGRGRGLLGLRTDTGWWRCVLQEEGPDLLEPWPSAAVVERLLEIADEAG